MQVPVKSSLLGRLSRPRSLIPGWVVGVIFLLIFLFMPQVVAPVMAQLMDPLFPGESFDLVLILSSAGIFVLMALGLNVVVGFAGLLDLGYAAFFAIGAYSYGLANFGTTHVAGQTLHLSVWPLLLAAPVIAAMCGVILGAPTLRLRGDYLAIVTLGFGEIVPLIFRNVKALGGVEGFNGLERPATLNLPFSTIEFPVDDSTNFYYLVLAVVVVATIGISLLRRSRIGRAWVAIREDETSAACSGINLVATKLLAFAIGASFSGFAGVLYASQYGSISYVQFGFAVSITILVMIVMGGMGSIPGVITGALVLGFVNRMLVQLPVAMQDPASLLHPIYLQAPNLTTQINESQSLIYGLILLLVILLRPQGLIPSAIRKRELKGEEVAAVGEGGVLVEVPAGAPESVAEVETLQALDVAQQDVVVESLDRPGGGDINAPSSGLETAGGGAAE